MRGGVTSPLGPGSQGAVEEEEPGLKEGEDPTQPLPRGGSAYTPGFLKSLISTLVKEAQTRPAGSVRETHRSAHRSKRVSGKNPCGLEI